MSAQKHTPGPWTAEHGIYGSIVCKDGKSMIAVWPEALGGPEFPHEANARLIAAAPELLEALLQVIAEKAPSYHDCTDDGLPECVWCEALAAIAKATGESA